MGGGIIIGGLAIILWPRKAEPTGLPVMRTEAPVPPEA